jgi:hypothetical protein
MRGVGPWSQILRLVARLAAPKCVAPCCRRSSRLNVWSGSGPLVVHLTHCPPTDRRNVPSRASVSGLADRFRSVGSGSSNERTRPTHCVWSRPGLFLVPVPSSRPCVTTFGGWSHRDESWSGWSPALRRHLLPKKQASAEAFGARPGSRLDPPRPVLLPKEFYESLIKI